MAREHYIAELEQNPAEFLRMGQLAQEALQAALKAPGDSNIVATGEHMSWRQKRTTCTARFLNHAFAWLPCRPRWQETPD